MTRANAETLNRPVRSPALPPTLPRHPAVDLARSAALAGMVVFHVAFDLEMFGLLAPGTTTSGGWAVFARGVAGSFLALAGVSLYLAHRGGLRPAAFLRRLAILCGAAGLVSLATYAMDPGRFVYFGILHSIAASSVLGLAFLRLPWAVTLAAAAVVITLPGQMRFEALDAPWFLWLGLGTETRPSLDYEPIFPWFGAFLLGLGAAQWAGASGLWPRLTGPRGPLAARLSWPGRHSLIIYLVHQPVIIGIFLAAFWLSGAPAALP